MNEEMEEGERERKEEGNSALLNVKTNDKGDQGRAN